MSLKVNMSEFVSLWNRNRDSASDRNSGNSPVHPFLPFHPEITILGIRRKVYVPRRDLLGIRASGSES